MTFTYFYTIINKDLNTTLGLTGGGCTSVQVSKIEFYYLKNCMKPCQAFLEQSRGYYMLQVLNSYYWPARTPGFHFAVKCTELCKMEVISSYEQASIIFYLLHFLLGSVHPSLDNLVVPCTWEVTTLMPNLVQTPYRHSALLPRTPGLKQSSCLSLLSGWDKGVSHCTRLLSIIFKLREKAE